MKRSFDSGQCAATATMSSAANTQMSSAAHHEGVTYSKPLGRLSEGKFDAHDAGTVLASAPA